MLIRPVRGTHPQTVVDKLLAAKTSLQNLYSAHHSSADDRRRAYVGWANTIADQFQGTISRTDVDRLVLTPPFWHIQALPSPPPFESRETINTEIKSRLDELEKLHRDVEAQVDQWANLGQCAIPDTSMFIQHPEKLEDWDLVKAVSADLDADVHVLIPMVVIDELDKLKEAKQGHTRWRARHSLFVIDRVLRNPRKPGVLRTSDFEQFKGALTVELVFDAPGHVRLPESDDEIVDQACMIEALTGPRTTLLTYDTGQSTRARAAGLTCHKFAVPPNGVEPSK